MTSAVGTVAWRSANEGLEVMTWPVFDDLPIDVIVTTRFGGVSNGEYASLNLGLHVGDDPASVIENRRRAARAIGAELGDLVFANQTHGRAVFDVTAADRGRGATSLDDAVDGVDAFVTAQAGPVLVTMCADCVPIVLYDPVAHVAASVHAGWRGTVSRVAEAAIETMGKLGAQPPDILAAIGPAVDPEIYEVGPEVATAAVECFGGDADDVLTTNAEGSFFFDLSEANRRILHDCGVLSEHIHLSGVPTGGDGPFFSDRAARPCGRFAVLVRLRPAP
jgi:YfiH family protein